MTNTEYDTLHVESRQTSRSQRVQGRSLESVCHIAEHCATGFADTQVDDSPEGDEPK